MTTWAIIPVKRLGGAKSGLGGAFDPDQRRGLVLAMLADVLTAVRQSSPVSSAVVVSPDRKVLDFARLHGAEGLAEPSLGLNGALKFAIRHAISKGVGSVLILPADLPLLRRTDVENLISMASAQKDVVIAPSKANGTNALLLCPPDLIDLKFGGESFPEHVRGALRAGVKPRIYRSPTIATDIDGVSDLLSVEARGSGTRTHDFLKRIHYHGIRGNP